MLAMPITVLCSGCSAKLAAPDRAAGKNVKCPKCQTLIAIPAQTPQPEAEPKFEVIEPPERPAAPARKRDRDQDDDDATPLSLEREEKAERPKPRKRRDEDDAEDDREPRPRRKKSSSRRSFEEPSRRRSRRRSGGNPLAGLGSGGVIGAAVVGLWLIGLVLGLIWPVALILPAGIGYLVAFVGGIWFLIIAFTDNAVQGLLCLFVPFYSLFYLISNWDSCKTAFLVQVGGVFMILITTFAAGNALKGKGALGQNESLPPWPSTALVT